jgi:long-chain acyl-CoA synthetase
LGHALRRARYAKGAIMGTHETLPKVFVKQVEKKKDKTFLMYKREGRWRHVTWEEAGEKVKRVSLGLMALGVKKGDRVCGISETIPDFAYCYLGIINAGAVFAPIYHTNSPKECAHVLNDSGARIAFAQDPGQLDKLKEAADWDGDRTLEYIIVFEKLEHETDPRIMSLETLCDMGDQALVEEGEQSYLERLRSVTPDDLIEIIYTSGTTGPPKGVMDTSAGMIKGLKEFARFHPFFENDRGVSHLPMAHAIELKLSHLPHIYFGFTQVYAESMAALYDNVRETDPTFLITTPRFLEKHYNTIWGGIESRSPWKKKLITWCLKRGLRYHNMKENSSRDFLYPVHYLLYLVAYMSFLRRVRHIVGRKIRAFHTGGAPNSPQILDFFRACGLPVYEGYGLTETRGLISLNRPGANKIGTVGKPLEGIVLTFAEENEILAGGWAPGKGYWNNPQATEELLRDGVVHTGDVGYLDEDGFLHLTGRKKDILITSSGKNISPLNIENLLRTSGYVSQAVVFGEGKTYLTALITLNPEEITKYARDNGITYADFAALTRNEKIVDLIQKEVTTRNQELARIEQVKKFTILEDEFRQDAGEVTPTLKVKRVVIGEKYRDKIEAMYKD